MKRIAHLLGVLKEELDDLCDAQGLTTEENGSDKTGDKPNP